MDKVDRNSKPGKLFQYEVFLMRLVAYYFLERIRIEKLRNNPQLLKRLYSVYDKAKGVECLRCGKCCRGGFNRFTIYDYIAQLMAGRDCNWGFRLYPFKPDFKNYCHGVCPYLQENGCAIPYRFRPYLCVMSFCDGKKNAPWKASSSQRKTIQEVKKDILKIQFRLLVEVLRMRV